MLSKKLRLTSEKDILKTRKGRSFKGSFFILNAVENKFNKLRIVIIVSKKVSLKSTERNLIKRRVSEILNSKVSNMEKVDLSINVLPTALNAKFSDLETDINYCLSKIMVIN